MRYFATALLWLLFAGQAFAASQDIKLSATVQTTCTISASETPAALVWDLTVGADGRVSTTANQFTLPVFCNVPSTMSLASSNKGLRGPSASSNYATVINYTATVSGPALPGMSISTASYQVPEQAALGTLTGDYTVLITPVASQLPLAAGAYNDTLNVTITPQQ